MTTETEITATQQLATALDVAGIVATFTPVPGKPDPKDTWKAFRWDVTVSRSGREILRTPYSMGTAYVVEKGKNLPAERKTVDYQRALKDLLETGNPQPVQGFAPNLYWPTPTREDVLGALLSDSEVIDYAAYEEWGPDLGFDVDSRKGEATYRQCLSIALALRAALGDTTLQELRDIAREL